MPTKIDPNQELIDFAQLLRGPQHSMAPMRILFVRRKAKQIEFDLCQCGCLAQSKNGRIIITRDIPHGAE